MKTETITKKIEALDIEIETFKHKPFGDFVAQLGVFNSLCDRRQALVDNLDARGIKYALLNPKK